MGWKITEDGEYRMALPRLSAEEEELVSAAEGEFREEARSKDFSSREEVLNSIKGIVLRTAQSGGIFLDREQLSYLPEMCFLHIYGFAFLEKLLEDPSIEEISVIGIGQHQLHLNLFSIVMGAHVRTGMEDNIYYKKGELAESNGQLVERLARFSQELGRDVATPLQARRMLGLSETPRQY